MEEKNRITEMEEAIEAADRALMSLSKAQSELDSAKGFGIWDMLGGGLISTMLKHSKTDDARNSIEEAKRSLRSLKKELADIRVPEDFKLDIGEFLTFADYFFDGLIADWMVQSKLQDAAEQVEEAKEQVKNLRSRLYAMRDELRGLPGEGGNGNGMSW